MAASQAVLPLSSGVRMTPPSAHSRAKETAATARNRASVRLCKGSVQRSRSRESAAPNVVSSIAHPTENTVTNKAENSQNVGVNTACGGSGSLAESHVTNHFTWAEAVVVMGIALITKHPSQIATVATLDPAHLDPAHLASNVGKLSCRLVVSMLIAHPSHDHTDA